MQRMEGVREEGEGVREEEEARVGTIECRIEGRRVLVL